MRMRSQAITRGIETVTTDRGEMASEQSKDVEMKEATEVKSEQASDETASDPARAQKDKDLLTFEGWSMIVLVASTVVYV